MTILEICTISFFLLYNPISHHLGILVGRGLGQISVYYIRIWFAPNEDPAYRIWLFRKKTIMFCPISIQINKLRMMCPYITWDIASLFLAQNISNIFEILKAIYSLNALENLFFSIYWNSHAFRNIHWLIWKKWEKIRKGRNLSIF